MPLCLHPCLLQRMPKRMKSLLIPACEKNDLKKISGRRKLTKEITNEMNYNNIYTNTICFNLQNANEQIFELFHNKLKQGGFFLSLQFIPASSFPSVLHFSG